jgi:hypothetical protein
LIQNTPPQILLHYFYASVKGALLRFSKHSTPHIFNLKNYTLVITVPVHEYGAGENILLCEFLHGICVSLLFVPISASLPSLPPFFSLSLFEKVQERKREGKRRKRNEI